MMKLPFRTQPTLCMGRGLVAGAALLLTGLTASAQDAPEPPSFDWTGFYAGVTAGVGGFNLAATVDDVSDSEQVAGFLGGVRAGYNVDFDPLVVGVEADLNFADLSFYEQNDDAVATSDIPWIATVRGRVGVAVPDTPLPALIYGTGGLAVAQIKHSIGDTSTVFDPILFGPNGADEARAGYVVGAGVEMAVTDNVLVGLEYLYMDFGKTTVDVVCVVCCGSASAGTSIPLHLEEQVQTIRLNLSWKFGG